MRNLKRALSLALATVMTLGLMVVGTGAAGYTDVTSEDNQEAIEVLQAVGIMTGVNDDGTEFNPDGLVTRNQMAVIMSQLLNLDYDYYRGINSFTDVPSWAAPYVAACVAEGVTAGIGDGLYGGENNITAAQAALMLMKALGYFQHQGDFTPDWQVATIRQGSYINLFDRVDANAEQALTRSQVAQMVLNALKADMVTFTGTVGMTINGVEVGYNPEYTARTSAAQKYNRIDTGTTTILSDNGQYYIQLGEELYDGDLSLDYSTDVFGRPAYLWAYDSKEIGTYLDETNMIAEYTEGVTGKDLYELLTRNTVANYDLEVVVDGYYEDEHNSRSGDWWFDKTEIVRTNQQSDIGATGTGVLTQVFVDNEEKVITITSINTYLALASNDYSASRDEVSLEVYGLAGNATSGYYRDIDSSAGNNVYSLIRVSNEDFDVADMLEGDAVLVTVADNEVQSVAAPEIVAETELEAFGSSSNGAPVDGQPNVIVLAGEEIDFNAAAEFDYDTLNVYTYEGGSVTNLKDTLYNVYLDPYGYVAGVEEVEGVDNYVFITGLDIEGNHLGASSAKANAIFLDGQMKPIDVNMKRSEWKQTFPRSGDTLLNTWCTYTVSSSGVYTLKEVSNVNLAGGVDAQEDTMVPNTTTIRVAQYRDTVSGTVDGTPTGDPNVITIDDRHVSLAGRYDNSTGNNYYKVYGTDETVYLSVGLDIEGTGTTALAYISEVNSVITGIGNASLEALSLEKAVEMAEDEADGPTIGGTVNDDRVSNGVYTLYNRDGDVIAAIVVGEDTGSSTALAYVDSSSVKRESYNTSTGIYTWTRDVIIDGQRATLTEVGDGLSDIGTMAQYTWYQVKYNADGNVISVRPASAAMDPGVDYITHYNAVSGAAADEDLVLYYQNTFAQSTTLDLIGKTLWVETTNVSAFRVAEDVNVAVIFRNNNRNQTTFETGASALDSIVTELNERNDNTNAHTYMVSAVLEDGIATSVIIQDTSSACDPYAPGDYDDADGDLELTGVQFTGSGIRVYFNNESGSALAAGTYKGTLSVVNASGKSVWRGTDMSVAVTAVADGASGSVLVSGYNGTPTTSGDYTVTLTLENATSEYTASDNTALSSV